MEFLDSYSVQLQSVPINACASQLLTWSNTPLCMAGLDILEPELAHNNYNYIKAVNYYNSN